MLAPYSENSSRQQNYPLHFDSRHKWQSPLLIFAIDNLFVSVPKINLHLIVGRSEFRAKVNAMKSQAQEKLKIKQWHRFAKPENFA